jgi:ribosomal 50S subunit-associated protein YjgA (DUF615 family)
MCKLLAHLKRVVANFSGLVNCLRNEDESLILSYLTPQQGVKKQVQLQRWVDRMIEQGDSAINEFSKQFNATENILCVSMSCVFIVISNRSNGRRT